MIRRHTKGFTLVEMLVYIAILVPITIATVTMMINYAAWLNSLAARTVLIEAQQDVIERLTREIRNADTVDLLSSSLATTTSSLALTGDNYDVVFDASTSTSSVTVAVEGGTPQALTAPPVSINRFVVLHHDGAETELVRFVLDMTASVEGQIYRETFYGGAVIRGSYD